MKYDSLRAYQKQIKRKREVRMLSLCDACRALHAESMIERKDVPLGRKARPRLN